MYLPLCAIVVVSATQPIDPAPLIAAARPELAPPSFPPTTMILAGSDIVAAHPTHLATDGYRIDTFCRGTFCVEELRIGRHVASGHRRALAHLRRELADPGHEDEVDATEVVLPQPSAAGFLSILRVESDYTRGAAHARGGITCETYVRRTGRRATVRDVVGRRDARRVIAAARREDQDLDLSNFVVPAPKTIDFCNAVIVTVR